MAVGGSGILTPQTASALPVCTTTPVTAGTDLGDGETLDTDQINNAEIIYSVGVGVGLPARAEIIAIATATQESRLVNQTVATNLDSLGLFQQRPSQGWGTAAQVTDPVYAATTFYTRLEAVTGWQTMPLTEAAQAVQRSGYPDAYAQWEPIATRLVATFAASSATCGSDSGTTGGGDTSAGDYTIPAGASAAATRAITFALTQLGKPYEWAATGPDSWDCSGLTQAAWAAAGIAIGRSTLQQVYAGTPVYTVADLQPGDLLLIPGSDGTPASPRHVGLYLGDGLLVDAPQTGDVVKIEQIAGYWQSNLAAMRHIA